MNRRCYNCMSYNEKTSQCVRDLPSKGRNGAAKWPKVKRGNFCSHHVLNIDKYHDRAYDGPIGLLGVGW